jgi:hypothetical protein
MSATAPSRRLPRGRLVGRPGLTLDEAFFRLPGTNAILEVGQFHNTADGERRRQPPLSNPEHPEWK